MIPIPELLVPILLSAVIVWVVSAVFWTVSPHHKHHVKQVGDEEGARAALKGAAPGLYWIPFGVGGQVVSDPDLRQRYEEGPVALVTVMPSGAPSMGKSMGLSLVFYVIVGFGLAYVGGRSLGPGASYLAVFRLVGTVAWMAYAAAVVPDSIWFGRPWKETAKGALDAFVYAMLSAGAFAGFWPEG